MAELLTVAMRGVTRRNKARLALSTEELHNRFTAKFIPAPALPTIGGSDMESIESVITNKHDHLSANG